MSESSSINVELSLDAASAAAIAAPQPAPKPVTLHAYYLSEMLSEPEKVVKLAAAKLKKVDFDTIVGTGLSGALIVPMLARKLKKHFAVVRKPDNSHSGYPLEGTLGSKWLFVDDLISSGATYRRVRSVITKVAADYRLQTEFVGAFCYYNIIESSTLNASDRPANFNSPGFKPAAEVERQKGTTEEAWNA